MLNSNLYRQLQIVNPPETKRSVSFTDLNEVKTYRKSDPPIWVSGRPVEELLRERIRYLEKKLDRITRDKENRTMTVMKPPNLDRLSLAGTEKSVTSPLRPVQAKAPTPARNDSAWQSRPVQLAHPPRNIQRALAAQPVAAPRQAPQPAQPAAPARPPVPSRARRFVSGLGALLAGPGLVAGLLSIVALGPAGLGVAAALAASGIFLMWVGSKMN